MVDGVREVRWSDRSGQKEGKGSWTSSIVTDHTSQAHHSSETRRALGGYNGRQHRLESPLHL